VSSAPASFDRDAVIERFAAFASAGDTSPLYSRLSGVVVAEPDLADPLAAARPGQRRPVLLLAAVQLLLRRERSHPLAASYPTLGGSLRTDPADAFVDFVRGHRDELSVIIARRNTQTNEVGRSAVLVLGLGQVAALAGGAPLALVEAGASAGLNLLMDRFSYRYGDGQHLGDAAPVHITCAVEGVARPPVPATLPAIASRLGLDLEPGDVRDDDTAEWLRSCVFGDDADRLARLDEAIALAREVGPPPLLAGDAVELVGPALDAVAADAVPVVYHSWALTYFERSRRSVLADELRAAAARRDAPIWWMSREAPGVVPGLDAPGLGVGATVLGLSRVEPDGAVEHRLLAECHAHGRWVRWLA
jgi:hypothetical protein